MHRFLAVLLTVVLLLVQIVSVPSWAQIPPTPPSPPPAPSAPPPPSAPTPPPAPSGPPPAPSAPAAPSAPPAPTPSVAPSAPSPQPSVAPPASSPQPPQDTGGDTAGATTGAVGADSVSGTGGESASGITAGETTGRQDGTGIGDPYINTGDANSSAILTNNANSNLGSGSGGSAEDITVGNTGNGTGSTNSADVDTSNNSSTIQTNDANVNNDLDLDSVSGRNDASRNTGVNNTIVTGDSNTTASVINGVNTNIDGVAVVEFNVDDTHTGDIILAMPVASGCTATVCGVNGNLTAGNTGNGVDSTNDASIDSTNTDNTFQSNSADVVNDLVLVADAGHNEADYNTGGNNSITTGDANVVATVGNFVNNNIAGVGEVLIAVVNIFGDLIGNIILPESTVAGGGTTTAANIGNGSGSTNTSDISNTNANTTTQTNVANIANNLDVTANTGDNSAENNTAGFSNGGNVVESGDAAIDVNVINIANSNVYGDDTWWLVFVNDASGNWVGYIVGQPEGATMAGSAGTEFIVGADGTIIAKNSGNGANSTNDASVATTNTTTTTQTNTANVTNNITMVANTGTNSTSYNTGGANSIKTGDANVMANIMNFVNNNFVGGKVVVTIVNVFGNWLGSFVPPGEEAPKVTAGIGGANPAPAATNGNGSGNGSGSQNDPADTSNTGTGGTGETLSPLAGITSPGTQGGVMAFLTGGNILGARTEPIVEEDDSIIVPGSAKTAGARTVVPAWFWKVFLAGLALIMLKRAARFLFHKKSLRMSYSK